MPSLSLSLSLSLSQSASKLSAFIWPENMDERLNTPHTDKIELDFLGHRLQLAQDPNSKHLGTTVWDSSMVFIKFLEQNCKKGELSHSKLAGKRVIELGAGCGLAGLGMALLGCHVVSTDQVEVLPLLMRNLDRNMARAKHSPSESPFLGSLGTVEVVELNWGDEEQIEALKPPFDYVIGSDIVYKEQLLEPLLSTLIGLAGPKTTVLLANEYRSSIVHERMLQLWKENFNMKIMPKSKMDPIYQHECIQIFSLKSSLKSKVPSSSSTKEQALKETAHRIEERERQQSEDFCENSIIHDKNSSELLDCPLENTSSCVVANDGQVFKTHDSNKSTCIDGINADAITCKEEKNFQGELSEWEIRRLGSMAARLMQNVSYA